MHLFPIAPLVLLLMQTGAPPLSQKPTGSIEGVVTRSGSGQPIPNARVTVNRRGQPSLPPVVNVSVAVAPAAAGARGSGPALPPIPATMTDDKGKFFVSGLEDGVFLVNVQANGYVAQPYGQKTRGGPGTPVNVSGGQPTKDINVAMTPAATISGRVHDPSDQPLINVPVQLMRYSYDFQGQRSYQSVGITTTDDRGQYRMYWVTPGRYYLMAGKPSTGSSALNDFFLADFGGGGANGNEVPSVLGYAFYPGVQEISGARIIDMEPGAELQSVDMTLATRPRTFKIRGKLIDSRTGKAAARGSVSVAPQMPGLTQDDAILGLDGGSTNYNAKTGTFEIRDLLPGTYSLVAMVMDLPQPGVRGPVGRSSAMIPVTVGSADVDDLTITTIPAAAVPGRVRIEGQLPANMSMERLRVQLTPVGGTQNSLSGLLANAFYQNTQTNVAPDGTFRMANIVPGDYRIDFSGFPINAASAPGGPTTIQYFGSMQTANAYIKDARFDGVDVLSVPLHFTGNVNNGLEISLGFGSGRVEGTVTDSRLQAVNAGRVVAVPDRMRFRTDLYRSFSVDQNGRFTFPTLPPGDYKIFAWESIEDNGWFDPELLSRSEARAASIHVNEGSTQSLSVQIIPAEVQR